MIELGSDGKPKEHFFRKAIDSYQHDNFPSGIIHYPKEIAKIMSHDIL